MPWPPITANYTTILSSRPGLSSWLDQMWALLRVVGLRSHTFLFCLQPSVLLNLIPASYWCFTPAGAGRNFTDCVADFIVTDEQMLQAYQINANTDPSLLLTNKDCLLINVWNEARCKGKQKMTASFVIVAHSVRLIYCNSDYFWTCCLLLDLYGWQKIHVLNAPSNRMLCKTLNFSSNIKRKLNSVVIETAGCVADGFCREILIPVY